ncbi:MAG: YdhK family protein [Bacillota bacterium]
MKKIFVYFLFVMVMILAACGSDNQEETGNTGSENHESHQESEDDSHGDHAGMDHSASGEIPEDMKEAENPKYEKGSKVIIEEGHMPGMKGAEATIKEAFDTTVYSISYDPVTGGERVENHKWVVHEELQEADQDPFQPGSEVTLEAEHMEGMQGAEAVVDTAEQKTVYVIDFTTLDGSEKIENHLWVTEEELSPVE